MATAIERYDMAQDTRITPAPEVEEVAQKLIRQYHQELLECSILYCFTTATAPCIPRKCNPEMRYAYSIHLPGCPKPAVEEGPDFRLFVNIEEWDALFSGQHEPFIDHRLEHISREKGKDEVPKFVLKPHSLEEFDATVQRFGRYNYAVKRFGQILQPELDLVVPEGAPRASDETKLTRHGPGYAPVTASVDDFRQATDLMNQGRGE
jgi:hypothetical protein